MKATLVRLAPLLVVTLTTPLWGQAPGNDSASVEACARVDPDTTGWQRVSSRHGFTVNLPPSFSRKHYEVTIGNPTFEVWQADLGASLRIDIMDGPEPLKDAGTLGHNRTFSYDECFATIAGMRVLLQAMRGSGTIFRAEGQWPSYDVYATFELRPGRYLKFWGSAAQLSQQGELLAAIHTVQMAP